MHHEPNPRLTDKPTQDQGKSIVNFGEVICSIRLNRKQGLAKLAKSLKRMRKGTK